MGCDRECGDPELKWETPRDEKLSLSEAVWGLWLLCWLEKFLVLDPEEEEGLWLLLPC